MRRTVSVALIAVLTATVSAQSEADRKAREACIATLSSFAVDPSVTKPPEVPDDLEGVSIEYFASGYLGTCPSFALRIEKNKAIWDGRAFVRKKGKAEKGISSLEFSEIVHAWLDAKLYAMRDDYCSRLARMEPQRSSPMCNSHRLRSKRPRTLRKCSNASPRRTASRTIQNRHKNIFNSLVG